jgi:hypothetical protein
METGDDDKDLLNKALAVKAIQTVGVGDVQPESIVDAFNRECVDFVRLWQRTHPETQRHRQRAPAMFIFSPSQLLEAVWPTAQIIPSFKKTCPAKLGGSLLVCNENLRLVLQADTKFKNEGDALTFLDKQGLRACAAIVFLPQQDAMLVHNPDADPNDAERVNLGRIINRPFSFDDLNDHLNQFYVEAVATHKGDCDIWSNAHKRELKPRAEQQIHRNLNMYLRLTIGRYGAKLDREVDSRWEGRSDLRVLKFVSPEEWQQAILELKVLRSTGRPIARDWALEGICQLIGYRTGEEEQTVACYLCCYDARTTDEEIPEVDLAAEQYDIIHRRFFMKTPGCGLRA